MKFSVRRGTYKQKEMYRSKAPVQPLLPNIKTFDPGVRLNEPVTLGSSKLRPRSTVVIRRIPNGDIGSNHPDEKLVSPEPLIPRSSSVSNALPITRARRLL